MDSVVALLEIWAWGGLIALSASLAAVLERDCLKGGNTWVGVLVRGILKVVCPRMYTRRHGKVYRNNGESDASTMDTIIIIYRLT